MKCDTNLSTPQSRITVLDALRGFTLLGIMLTHMLDYFSNSPSFGMEDGEYLFPALDAVIKRFVQIVISGKFIIIFSFLFGLSFFIQMDKAEKKGIDFRKRFIWRMVILFIIGIAAKCFFKGDVLCTYAITGTILVFLYKVKNWILLAVVFLLLAGTPRILLVSCAKITHTEQISNTHDDDKQLPASYISQQQEKPSFVNSVKYNLTEGLYDYIRNVFGLRGLGYRVMALFILGLIAGRIRFFEKVQIRSKRNIVLLAGFLLTALLLQGITHISPSFNIRSFAMTEMDSLSLATIALVALHNIGVVATSGALVMGFIILYQTKHFGKYLDSLSHYGRMGLTNYEMQNFIGCLLFSMWAFGATFGSWGETGLFALGLLIYALQMILSKYWLKHFLYGPLEWFWRTATYLKWQPMRKTDK
jgi:uncharacterized protein